MQFGHVFEELVGALEVAPLHRGVAAERGGVEGKHRVVELSRQPLGLSGVRFALVERSSSPEGDEPLVQDQCQRSRIANPAGHRKRFVAQSAAVLPVGAG